MSDAMANDVEDEGVANNAKLFYTIDRGNPVSLGPGVSFKKRQPLLNVVYLPEIQQSESPGSVAQELVSSPKKEKHGDVLWSKGKWADNIQVSVRFQVTSLTQKIREFDNEASKPQKALLKATEEDFQIVLQEAQKKQEARDLKNTSRPGWKAKLQSGLSTFCETAHHYQKVLDVLNEQAPEYTSAIWGAIKILLIASVNSEKLKVGVLTHLEEIGRQFEIMQIFVDLQPSESMVQTVTAAYSDFIKFLKKAIKYYTQCAPKRLINSIARPWETRFEPIVTRIRENVTKIAQVAGVGHVITSTKTLQMTHRLEDGQTEIRQGIQALGQGEWEIIQEQQKFGQTQEKDSANIQAIRDLMETSLRPIHRIEEQPPAVHMNGPEPITAVQERAIEYMESIEATTKVEDVQEKEEDWLAYYVKPENKIVIFRDEVFPILHKLDNCGEKNMHRGLEHDRLESIAAANLRRREEVIDWLGSTQSELLWIDGFAEVGNRDWTTNFCMEVEDAAKPVKTITVLSYYCSEQANTVQLNRPEIILQSFVFQLISRHRQRFTWIACREFSLTRFRFQQAMESSTKLWALFHDCLRIAEAPCLYVIFDNIDALWSKTCKGSEGIEKFESILQGLNKLAHGQERLGKILITSRLPNALECFSAMETTHCPKKAIVKLPLGIQKGVTMFGPPKRIHRLPIRRFTAPQIPPDPETLLANVDKSDEECAVSSEDEDVSAESPKYKDSDDDEEYGVELLEPSKDYARYLDSPVGSDSDVEEATCVEEIKKSLPKRNLDGDDRTDDEHCSNRHDHAQKAKKALAHDSTDEDNEADFDLDEQSLRHSAKLRRATVVITNGPNHKDSDADDDLDDLLYGPFQKPRSSVDDARGSPPTAENSADTVAHSDGEAETKDVDSDECPSDLGVW